MDCDDDDGLCCGIANRFLRVPAAGRSQWVRTVDDDGPGIAEEERDRVFRPFVRLEDSRNRKTGGTGLGLAIVKKVMDRHGATIRLDEAPGGGLRVMVEMDLA